MQTIDIRPLEGIKVLDLTRLLPGNYCCQLLSMLGAEVIKVEDPMGGDYMRAFGTQIDGQGSTHWQVNRGKRSIILDLKSKDAQAVLKKLVSSVDVLVESFRPGVMERMGLGYEDLRLSNPSLIYASLTGFGSVGSLRSTAGHDLNYLAFTGFLERLGSGSGTETISIPPIPLADLIGGGLYPSLAVVAALMRHQRTGVGCRIDCALAEGVALMPNLVVSEILANAQVPGRSESDFSGGLPYYRVYPCADGAVSVGCVEKKFFNVMATTINKKHLIDLFDDRSNHEAIDHELRSYFRDLLRSEIDSQFEGVDACVMTLNSYEEMLKSEQSIAAGYVRPCEGSPVDVLAPPIQFDGARPSETIPAPRYGQHTIEVLTEYGYSRSEIDALTHSQSIVQH